MKLRSLLLIFIVCCYFSINLPTNCASQPSASSEQLNIPGNPALPGINIVINTSNQAHAHQDNKIHQQTDQDSQQQTKVIVQEKQDQTLYERLSEIDKMLRDFATEKSTQAQNHLFNLYDWTMHHKFKTGAGLVLACYTCLAFQIYQANQVIQRANSWCNWQQGRSLDNLLESSQTQLEADLLFAMQTKYVHPTNPTDFIYSIVQSSQSLQTEMQVLQGQLTRYEWIQSCRCLPIFFLKDQDVHNLQDQHRKLKFLQHIFASWCAHYKIDQNH